MSKELAGTATGRLNNGIPQIPPLKGSSDLQHFTKTLPINQYKEDILKMIKENQVCLISGETGSGKTTQVLLYFCFFSVTIDLRAIIGDRDIDVSPILDS